MRLALQSLPGAKGVQAEMALLQFYQENVGSQQATEKRNNVEPNDR
jgi:hypothetical protein